VLKFNPDEPNSVEKTKTYYAFRLMARGILGGRRLELVNPLKKLKILALLRNQKELVISLLNPSKKRFRDISIRIDESINLKEKAFLKVYQCENNYRDDYKESSCRILKNFDIEAKSITQFVIPIYNQK